MPRDPETVGSNLDHVSFPGTSLRALTWGAQPTDPLEPLAGLSGWHIDLSSMVEIDRTLPETIVDAAGPEFMAPPDQLGA